MNRRTFLSNTPAFAGAAMAASKLAGAQPASNFQGQDSVASPLKPKPFVGVQSMPQSVFDEGAGYMLDYMQREGGIETLCVSTHVIHSGGGRFPEAEADHGVPGPEATDKPLTRIWIPYDDANFEDTSLRMPQGDPDKEEYGGVDVLEEVIGPAHERGMKVYARHLEGFHHPLLALFPAFKNVRQVSVYNERKDAPCWNHPEYRAFWYGYVRDVLARYPVDGLYLGAERDAPFGPLFHGGGVPTCFCEHCIRKGQDRNIDPQRAKEGMTKLHQLMINPDMPDPGMMAAIYRIWMKYPETLAWEQLQSDSKWSLFAELYRFGKSKRRDIEIGWHLPMYPLNHDLFNRAGWDYEELAQNCDFLKASIYFDVNASRLHRQIPSLRKHYLRDFESNEAAYSYLLSVLNMDKSQEPSYEEAATAPFSPNYVAHETRRLVQGLAGDAKAYSGIGVNIPGGTFETYQPEWTYNAVMAALGAGADGMLYSREYHFMKKENLNAARDAVEDFRRGKDSNIPS